jgi:hypothetical protein
MQRIYSAQVSHHSILIKGTTKSFGLMFFSTPQSGPNNESSKIAFGKACVSIAHLFIGKPTNDIMEALDPSSLFSDTLKESFRHQLENYRIVSFYEGDERYVSNNFADWSIIDFADCS